MTKADHPPIMWVGFIQLVEDSDRTKRMLSQSKKELSSILPSEFICTISSPESLACQSRLELEDWLCRVSSLLGHTVDFGMPASIMV